MNNAAGVIPRSGFKDNKWLSCAKLGELLTFGDVPVNQKYQLILIK
jgi:hypothetical protein